MRQKLLALLLTVTMLFSMSAAAISALAVSNPTISLEKKKAYVGDEVSIAVSIENNPGIWGMDLRISYDKTAMTLTSVENGNFYQNSEWTKGNLNADIYTLSYEAGGLENISTASGTLATLNFKINENAVPGTYEIKAEYTAGDIINISFDEIAFDISNGSVTVENKPVPVTGIALDRETASIGTGETLTLTPIFSPETATNKNVTWSSSDPSVASVNETTGEITGVKKGLATITIITTDGGFTDTCVVTVSCAHKSKTQIIEKASTCTKKGWDTYSQCDICGQLFDETDNEIDKIPYRALIAHTQSEPVRENEVAATCETAGNYDEVVYCTVCHTEISREIKTILPLEHDWNEGTVTTSATCTTDGVKTFTCKHDASHTYTEAISAIGHTPTEAAIENEISASCSFTGSYDEVAYCSVCHEEVSRVTKTIPIDEDAHDWGEWVQTKAPTATESGEEIRICEHNPSHYETRKIPPIGPNETEYSFLDDEVIIVAPSGAIPEESTFDVQKIVPPPQEIVEKVKNQFGNSSSVLAYYEVRLTTGDGTPIIKLNGEITIKVKIPQEYLGSKSVQLLQEDETGKLVVMTSWWENDYLCYKTDWLEIY